MAKKKKARKEEVTKKQNLGVVVAILLSPIVLGLIMYFWYLFTSPQHALAKANTAVKENNFENFQTYVAVDSIAKKLGESLLKLKPSTIEKLIGADGASQLAGLSLSEIEAQITQELQVSFGAEAPQKDTVVHQLLAKLSLLDIHFAGVESLDEQKSKAYVVVRFAGFGGRTIVKPNLIIKHNKDNWMIVDVVNLEVVVKKLAGEI